MNDAGTWAIGLVLDGPERRKASGIAPLGAFEELPERDFHGRSRGVRPLVSSQDHIRCRAGTEGAGKLFGEKELPAQP